MSVNYTNRDFESLRRNLLERIPQLTERWTDHNPSDLGVVLLELFAGVGDMLAYYMDAQVGEGFLATARQRQSVINICKLVSYRLDSAVAATTELTFMLDAPVDFDLTIPKGTSCRAYVEREAIPFETVEAVTIFRGQTEATVSARQGWREMQSFVGTGLPWQSYRLSARDIAQGSIRLNINGEDWTEVLHFRESDRADHHFRVDTDALDNSRIIFGEGVRGAVPPSGVPIVVDYLRTLGKSGNIGRHLINQVQDSIRVGGTNVAVMVTNRRPATGGSDRETLDHARSQAPAELRSVWKAVTKEDFRALAEGYPGVGKAQVLDTNDCSHHPYFHVNLAVAPSGGGAPSAQLLKDLQEYLESRKLITTEISLYEPFYRPVHIDVDVVPLPGEDREVIKARVEESLAEFFQFDRVGFGQAINRSDIVALIDNLRGVSHVDLHTPANNMELANGQIPVLGAVLVNVRTA